MRRKTDKFQHRIIICLASLACALGVLAAVLGYRALSAMDIFVETIQVIGRPRVEFYQ